MELLWGMKFGDTILLFVWCVAVRFFLLVEIATGSDAPEGITVGHEESFLSYSPNCLNRS